MARQGGRIVIWPVYFSSKRSRKEGRRVPRGLSMAEPSLQEIAAALDGLGVGYEIQEDRRYPGAPGRKSGRILVDQQGEKEALLRAVAQAIKAQRS